MTIKYAIFRLSYKYRIPNLCNVVNTRDEMMKELFKLYQKQIEYYTQIKDSEDLFRQNENVAKLHSHSGLTEGLELCSNPSVL